MVSSEVYAWKSKEYAELIKNPNKKDAMRDQILDKLKYIPYLRKLTYNTLFIILILKYI